MASFSHSYDVRGNLKALTELGATKTYSYDQIERLTAEARQAANGTSTPAESYSYDGEGNVSAAPSPRCGWPGVMAMVGHGPGSIRS